MSRRDPVDPSRAEISPARTDDWPKQAADGIVELVEQVRDRTTGKVLFASRALVWGFLLLPATIVLAVLFGIITIRLLNEASGDEVWVVYGGIGVLFFVLGLALMAKAGSPPVDD